MAKTCEVCKGQRGTKEVCSGCSGQGCNKCNGTGLVIVPCWFCSGRGSY